MKRGNEVGGEKILEGDLFMIMNSDQENVDTAPLSQISGNTLDI